MENRWEREVWDAACKQFECVWYRQDGGESNNARSYADDVSPFELGAAMLVLLSSANNTGTGAPYAVGLALRELHMRGWEVQTRGVYNQVVRRVACALREAKKKSLFDV